MGSGMLQGRDKRIQRELGQKRTIKYGPPSLGYRKEEGA